METNVDYFTKEITFSPNDVGSYSLDLFQHLAPYESNKHQKWQIACQATYIQACKPYATKTQQTNELDDEEISELVTGDQDPPPVLVIGMPVIVHCSHSCYTYKDAKGEIQKNIVLCLFCLWKTYLKSRGKNISMASCMKLKGVFGCHSLLMEMTLHESGYNTQQQESTTTDRHHTCHLKLSCQEC